MPESLWDWSRTALSNGTADSSIGWAEGMAPAAINNSARSMMAAVAKFVYDLSGQIVTAGTSTVYTTTTTSGLGSLAEGRMLCVEMSLTCGAAPTMNVDSLGAKGLYRYAPSGVVAIAANELRAGGRYLLQYDTSLNSSAGGWVVLNPTPVIVTADLPDDGVTYAKIQNVVNDDRLLGRVSGANGDIEELTITQALDLVDSTRGTLPYRGASAWAGLDPNTAGFVLRDGGAGADPSWVGGMTLLNSGTASSAATLDITLPTGYRAYKIILGPAFYPTTDAAVMGMRYSYDSGSTFQNTGYSWCELWTSTQAASSFGTFSNNDAGAWAATGICLGAYVQDNSGSALQCFEIDIFQGDGSNNARCRFSSSYLHSSGGYNTFTQGSANHSTLDVIDAVRILASTGNVSGKWALYGIS